MTRDCDYDGEEEVDWHEEQERADEDEFADIEEDDRDASYYEYMWDGPEGEELDDYGEDDDSPAAFKPFTPPLLATQPCDEVASRQHFVVLKQKYKVESFEDTSPLSPLYTILLKFESNEPLDKVDAAWLRKSRTRGPIATCAAQQCEGRFKETGDAWEVVGASRFWRMAEQPMKALAATDGLVDTFSASLSRLKSAILTTRGGAFRDLRRLDDAEACGQQAVQVCRRSCHPYMLLGAVYYQKGDPKRGEEHFAVAGELGSKPGAQEWEIRKAVRLADEEEQRTVARYLLEKDPVKYHWAKKYLQ